MDFLNRTASALRPQGELRTPGQLHYEALCFKVSATRFWLQSSLSFFVLFLSLAFFFYFLSCRLLPRALWLVFVSRCFVSNGFWFAPGGEPVDRARHPAPRRLCGAGAGRRPVRAAGVAGVASGLDRPTFDRRRRLRTDAFLHSQGVFFSSLGLQPAGVVTHRLRTPISRNGLPLGS